jgi:nucleotide-binding universal stress UspA family protein
MKVLLPVYGVDDAHLIIDFVVNYRWPPATAFKVIHVLGTSDTDATAQIAEDAAKTLILSVLNKLKEHLTKSEFSSELVHGAAILEIVNAAGSWKADMIVMGYRTIPMKERLLSGSVSNGVVMQAPCSVAIIRPPINNYGQQGSQSHVMTRAQ